MSATMNAIEYNGHGDSGVIRVVRRPIPEPSVGEVLIRVHAAGVNRPDILQRAGNYPPPPGASDIPGLEIAGEVVANGPCSEDLEVGARVMALVSGGGYAEYCVAPVPQTLPVPERLSAEEAAAVPETFFHGMDQRLPAVPPQGGRDVPGPWRSKRHWHDRHPARRCQGCTGVRDRRQRFQMPRLRGARCGARVQLPHEKLR